MNEVLNGVKHGANVSHAVVKHSIAGAKHAVAGTKIAGGYIGGFFAGLKAGYQQAVAESAAK